MKNTKLLFFYLSIKYLELFIHVSLFVIMFGYYISHNVIYCDGICEEHTHTLINKYCTIPCTGQHTCNSQGDTLFRNVVENIQQQQGALSTRIQDIRQDPYLTMFQKRRQLTPLLKRERRLNEDLDSAMDVYSRIS